MEHAGDLGHSTGKQVGDKRKDLSFNLRGLMLDSSILALMRVGQLVHIDERELI